MTDPHAVPRDSRRVPIETRVQLKFERFAGFISEFSSNVSPGGMFVRTRTPKPAGTVLSFEFRLRDGFELIRGRGEVIWIRTVDESAEKRAGMGIRFLDLSPGSRDLIYKIVDEYILAGGVPFDLAKAQASALPPAEAKAAALPVSEPQPAADLPPAAAEAPPPAPPLAAVPAAPPVEPAPPLAAVPAAPPVEPAAPIAPAAPSAPAVVPSEIPPSAAPPTLPSPTPRPVPVAAPPPMEPIAPLEWPAGIAPPTPSSSAAAIPPPAAKRAAPGPPSPAPAAAAPAPRPVVRWQIVRWVLLAAILGLGALVFFHQEALLGWILRREDAGAPRPLPVTRSAPQLARPPVATVAGVAVPAVLAAGAEPPKTAVTELQKITWEKAPGGGTDVLLWGDGAFDRQGYTHLRVEGDPPRELVRLTGILHPFAVERMTVGTPQVLQVRTGYHAGPRGELHVVLDLTGPGVEITDIKVDAGRLRIHLQGE